MKKNLINVVYQIKNGIPEESLEIRQEASSSLGAHQVRVKTRLASINPADINRLEGIYPDPRPLPRTLGIESIGEITELGSAVKNLKIGDHVIPLKILVGLWCDEYVANAEEIFSIPKEIPFEEAVLFRLVPSTAWCLLHQFVKLNAGDWIIQNAANSAVGKCVIIMAKYFGWKTINIVRREELIPELKALGADVVLSDPKSLAELRLEHIKEGRALLGLNAVGGSSVAYLARALDRHGFLVSYGAMSRQPLLIENSINLFQDIKFMGFRHDDWIELSDLTLIRSEYEKMLPLLKAGLFNFPYEKIYELSDIKKAIKHATQSERRGKVLIKFS